MMQVVISAFKSCHPDCTVSAARTNIGCELFLFECQDLRWAVSQFSPFNRQRGFARSVEQITV